jgi:hypothetical protein
MNSPRSVTEPKEHDLTEILEDDFAAVVREVGAQLEEATGDAPAEEPEEGEEKEGEGE